MAQMKEQSSKKIKPNEEDVANLSDAEFKTLVIRMLTEMVEHGHKIEETVKALKSEIKENVKGTNSKVKETRIQINSLDQKEEINIQLEHNEETRIQKIERLRNLWDNFKHYNIWIIVVPEGEEQEQEMEKLLEQILENFPNLAKEIDFQEVQEAQSAKKVGPKENYMKTHHR